MTTVTPVFDETGGRLLLFTASRAHHADVGGITPGSMPPMSRSIEDEGALVRPTRIVRDSVLDEARVLQLLLEGRWPARNPAQNLADLKAQLAGNAMGATELRRAIAQHGERTVLDYMGEARTPLIISGAIDDKSDLYNTIDKLIPQLSAEDYDLDERSGAADRAAGA